MTARRLPPGLLAPASALLLLLLLLAPSAAAVPTKAYDTLDGVPYLFLAGANGQGRLEAHLPDLVPAHAIDGCAFAQLRPEKANGRVAVAALVTDASGQPTLLEADFVALQSPAKDVPTIRLDTTDDGAIPYGEPQHPAVPAQVATFGLVTIDVDGAPLLDPIGDGELLGSLLDTTAGFRDDATLGVTAPQDDAELHVRISSPPDAEPKTHSFVVTNTAQLPTGQLAPATDYHVITPFNNTKFGGRGHFDIASSAVAPPGQNQLLFRVLGPDGAELANATVSPSLVGDAGARLEFPLDRFGAYTLDVSGRAAFARYSATATLEPPAAFDLDFWWEDVSYGEATRETYAGCQRDLGSTGPVRAAFDVGRLDPPSFPMAAVILGITAGAATVMLLTKLAVETIASARLKRSFSK